ncbi:MAG: hypothetical protein IJJ41_08535 [Clostridia bacterium]|nr:hypothetical protein [Clostridia bacterium]
MQAQTVAGLSIQKQVGDYTFFAPTAQGYWFRFCNCYLCLSLDFSAATLYLADMLREDGSYEASYLAMQAYMYRLVTTGNFMIHSAAAVYKNDAVLFCGLSGAGKSTQANLWKEYLNCSILNYDKPCVIEQNGTIFAHGCPWSGKEALFLNEYHPLKAIVYVKQAKENKVVRLNAAEAFGHIYLHNYVYPLTPEVEADYIAAIQKVAKQIPVYELHCDVSEAAVKLLFETLYGNESYQQAKEKV